MRKGKRHVCRLCRELTDDVSRPISRGLGCWRCLLDSKTQAYPVMGRTVCLMTKNGVTNGSCQGYPEPTHGYEQDGREKARCLGFVAQRPFASSLLF